MCSNKERALDKCSISKVSKAFEIKKLGLFNAHALIMFVYIYVHLSKLCLNLRRRKSGRQLQRENQHALFWLFGDFWGFML